MLDEPKSSHLIDELILDGLRYQAQQQLAWLQQAPIPLAIQAFLNSNSPHPQLPDVLKDGATTLCRDWLRRLRAYDGRTLARLHETFSPRAMMPVPFGLEMQCELGAAGVVLPPARPAPSCGTGTARHCSCWPWPRRHNAGWRW